MPDEAEAAQQSRAVQDALPDVLAGALAGHALAGPAGMAAGAAAPALAALWRGARAADERQWRQAAQAANIAAHDLGADADTLVDRALADSAGTELLHRVTQAAGRSTIEQKVAALGRVLAHGLKDPTAVDEALLLAAALGDLEAPHVEVLQLFEERASIPDLDNNQDGWTQHDLGLRLKTHHLIMPALLSTLDRHGLVTSREVVYPGSTMRVRSLSNLGRTCLELLRGSSKLLEGPSQAIG